MWLWTWSAKGTLLFILKVHFSAFTLEKSVFVSRSLFCLVYFTSFASIKSAPVCSGIESSCLLCSSISHLGSWAASQWQTSLSALVGNEHLGSFGCFPLDLVKQERTGSVWLPDLYYEKFPKTQTVSEKSIRKRWVVHDIKWY